VTSVGCEAALINQGLPGTSFQPQRPAGSDRPITMKQWHEVMAG
jgi:hypothetical protein